MLFTDPLFLFYFLPLTLLLHSFTTRNRQGTSYNNASRLLIFVLTVFFYGCKSPHWLIPFFICIFFDFLWASLLVRTQNPKLRLLLCSFSVIQNLSLLALFKYWNFFLGNLALVAPDLASQLPRLELDGQALLLPAGISFYTFESLSFVIDIYRRDCLPPKNPLDFFAFIGMFPRFIAGPIVRYKDMTSQFNNYSGMKLQAGLTKFIEGFFLKVCLADSFAIFVNYAFKTPTEVSFIGVWVGVLAYTMQIYFDFSGYSLMAIGLGECLGFEFPPNFKQPYLAKSLKDFWRRWHISLSTWLRDYLYLSLGGSRHGTFRTYLNLFLTMLLGGIWHGANWTFVAWGAWHGLWLVLERAFSSHVFFSETKLAAFRTMLIVIVGWVFFRADNIAEAVHILRAMVSPWNPVTFNPDEFWNHGLSTLFCVFGLYYAFIIESSVQSLSWFNPVQWGRSLVLFIISVILALSSMTIPFLYFQF